MCATERTDPTVCSLCGAKLERGAAKCPKCNQPVKHACPQCQNPVRSGVRFCPRCGYPLWNDVSSRGQPAPGKDPTEKHLSFPVAKVDPAAAGKKQSARTGSQAQSRAEGASEDDLLGAPKSAATKKPSDERSRRDAADATQIISPADALRGPDANTADDNALVVDLDGEDTGSLAAGQSAGGEAAASPKSPAKAQNGKAGAAERKAASGRKGKTGLALAIIMVLLVVGAVAYVLWLGPPQLKHDLQAKATSWIQALTPAATVTPRSGNGVSRQPAALSAATNQPQPSPVGTPAQGSRISAAEGALQGLIGVAGTAPGAANAPAANAEVQRLLKEASESLDVWRAKNQGFEVAVEKFQAALRIEPTNEIAIRHLDEMKKMLCEEAANHMRLNNVNRGCEFARQAATISPADPAVVALLTKCQPKTGP